jgi:hypothetical protein
MVYTITEAVRTLHYLAGNRRSAAGTQSSLPSPFFHSRRITVLNPTRFLRTVLAADAIACGVMGALLLIGAQPLAILFGLPTPLLVGAGAFLLPLAAWVGYLSKQTQPSRRAVWLLIVGNGVWVAESVLLLVLDWVQPTALGTTFIVAQAVATAVFAELEYVALKRSGVYAQQVHA